ncbi:Translocon-associated protein [Sesbania bispinosa]|nr:Translocon-associated protein [Sesbania bispinosa]
MSVSNGLRSNGSSPSSKVCVSNGSSSSSKSLSPNSKMSVVSINQISNSHIWRHYKTGNHTTFNNYLYYILIQCKIGDQICSFIGGGGGIAEICHSCMKDITKSFLDSFFSSNGVEGESGGDSYSRGEETIFVANATKEEECSCQSDSDEAVETAGEVSDVGIVGDETDNVQDFGDESFPSAPGIDTICVFPKNSAKLVTAGEETELLVGVKNYAVLFSCQCLGHSSLNVVAVKASVHLPFDHRLLVQNLTAQVFNNGSVPASTQAAFQYIFAVSKFLQAGTFDLVGTILYEIDQHPYQNTFYNGTIEVVEAGAFLSMESVFLVTLGAALLVLLGLWIHGQIQNLSKKTKRAPKVEVGTKTTDASMDEWLQGSKSGTISYNFALRTGIVLLDNVNLIWILINFPASDMWRKEMMAKTNPENLGTLEDEDIGGSKMVKEMMAKTNPENLGTLEDADIGGCKMVTLIKRI